MRHRCGEGAGHVGEQHVACRQVRKRRDPLRAQELRAQHATLDDQDVVVLGEALQRLCRSGWVSVCEGQRGGAEQQIGQLVGHALGSDTSEGHLHDLHLGLVCLELATEVLLILDREAGVLGEEHRLRVVEALLDVGDGLDLFGSWHSSSSSYRKRAPVPRRGALEEDDLRRRRRSGLMHEAPAVWGQRCGCVVGEGKRNSAVIAILRLPREAGETRCVDRRDAEGAAIGRPPPLAASGYLRLPRSAAACGEGKGS